MEITHLVDLDKADKPLRRVYSVLTPAGEVFAKVIALAKLSRFGSLGWSLTGSHCRADGTAFPDATHPTGAMVHEAAHEVSIRSDAAVDVSAALNAGFLLVAARVAQAVLHERAALNPLPPPELP